MAGLRWQLTRLELHADIRSARRLAFVLLSVVVMGLTGLPILAVAAAGLLDGWLGIAQVGWLFIFGLTLLAGAAVAGWLGWRRFRRRLVGLAETREELREDLVWLRDWFQPDEQPADNNTEQEV